MQPETGVMTAFAVNRTVGHASPKARKHLYEQRGNGLSIMQHDMFINYNTYFLKCIAKNSRLRFRSQTRKNGCVHHAFRTICGFLHAKTLYPADQFLQKTKQPPIQAAVLLSSQISGIEPVTS